MAVTKEKKEQILKKLVEAMKGAKSVAFAEYKGISMKDLSRLRAELRKAKVTFTVAKKTLIRLAAKEAGFDNLPDEIMEGPIGAVFSMEDEIAAVKILHKFSKKVDAIKIKGALFNGRVLSTAEAKALALLPSKEELLAKFVYLLKSPITGFHGVLKNTISGFVRALNAIKEKREQAV